MANADNTSYKMSALAMKDLTKLDHGVFFVLRPVVSYGTQRPRGLFLPLFSRPRKRKNKK